MPPWRTTIGAWPVSGSGPSRCAPARSGQMPKVRDRSPASRHALCYRASHDEPASAPPPDRRCDRDPRADRVVDGHSARLLARRPHTGSSPPRLLGTVRIRPRTHKTRRPLVPPKADISCGGAHVGFGPRAEVTDWASGAEPNKRVEGPHPACYRLRPRCFARNAATSSWYSLVSGALGSAMYCV